MPVTYSLVKRYEKSYPLLRNQEKLLFCLKITLLIEIFEFLPLKVQSSYFKTRKHSRHFLKFLLQYRREKFVLFPLHLRAKGHKTFTLSK